MIGSFFQPGLLNSSFWRQGLGSMASHHGHKAGDALTTTTTIAKLPLEPIELNACTKGNLPEVFTRIALNIKSFPHESNNRHRSLTKSPDIVLPGIAICNQARALLKALWGFKAQQYPCPQARPTDHQTLQLATNLINSKVETLTIVMSAAKQLPSSNLTHGIALVSGAHRCH